MQANLLSLLPVLAKHNSYNMLIINVKDNESIDKALKRFKKKFEKTGVLRQLRSRTAFKKPSVKRRMEVIKATYKERMYGNHTEQ
jgi:small subunit ribosomal protein S21